MASAKLSIPANPTYENLLEVIGNRYSKRIGNNTTLINDRGDCIKVQLHSTIIAEFRPGKLTINSGGYHTKTTKGRLNDLIPARYAIAQRDHEWHVYDRHNDWAESEYFDGMVFDV